MNSVVLSGVSGIVLSGVGLSCYQACQSAAKPCQHWVCAPLNLSNLITLTIDKDSPPRWIDSEKGNTRQFEGRNQPKNQTRLARQKQPGFPGGRAAP
ncbi:hypothetical protein DBV39_10140 [Orrella marina]|uniref:Uncharacterized protein n=1 Tax=Orrella marina TaxID=2163011 RepID=A0A2R4XJP9_9BURK|nr:hypothetical protein DBV39_10140 [Orrella marina]